MKKKQTKNCKVNELISHYNEISNSIMDEMYKCIIEACESSGGWQLAYFDLEEIDKFYEDNINVHHYRESLEVNIDRDNTENEMEQLLSFLNYIGEVTFRASPLEFVIAKKFANDFNSTFNTNSSFFDERSIPENACLLFPMEIGLLDSDPSTGKDAAVESPDNEPFKYCLPGFLRDHISKSFSISVIKE